MRARGIFVSIATIGLMVGPAFAHGVVSSIAGARQECTITGSAADDTLTGTTRDDVICSKAGSDAVDGEEGNDVIRGGQGDDGGGQPPCQQPYGNIQRICAEGLVHGPSTYIGLNGGDGSDVVKGQQDDDSMEGQDQNDKLYGGQGDDCLGEDCTVSDPENGNDLLKTRDKVSGNDTAAGGNNTDTCRIDAGDNAISC